MPSNVFSCDYIKNISGGNEKRLHGTGSHILMAFCQTSSAL